MPWISQSHELVHALNYFMTPECCLTHSLFLICLPPKLHLRSEARPYFMTPLFLDVKKHWIDFTSLWGSLKLKIKKNGRKKSESVCMTGVFVWVRLCVWVCVSERESYTWGQEECLGGKKTFPSPFWYLQFLTKIWWKS